MKMDALFKEIPTVLVIMALITLGCLIGLLPMTDANAKNMLQGRITTDSTLALPLPEERLRQSRQKMDRLFRQLAQHLDSTASEKLNAAQQAWTRYSQAECEFNANYTLVEPLHRLGYEECLLSLTDERVAKLQNELEWLPRLDPRLRLTQK